MRSELPNESISRRDENDDSYASWMSRIRFGRMTAFSTMTFCALVLGMLVGEGLASRPAYGAEAPAPTAGYFEFTSTNTYNTGDTVNSYATYTIAFNADGSINYANSNIVLTQKSAVLTRNPASRGDGANWNGYTTNPIPITNIVDPVRNANGTISFSSISFATAPGTTFDPVGPKHSDLFQSAGMTGTIDLMNGPCCVIGKITDSFNILSNGKVTSTETHTTTVTSIVPDNKFTSGKPPAIPADEIGSSWKGYLNRQAAATKSNPAKSEGDSVIFDAASKQLTITDDVITDTSFVGDPAVGASVNVPSLTLIGQLPDGSFVFAPDVTMDFTVATGPNVFLDANLPLLFYQPSDNEFYGALIDTTFIASLGSPWIDEMSTLFDPTSAAFDPDLLPWFTYRPNQNFLSATDEFSVSDRSGGVNGIFAADALPQRVPEPPTIWIFILGLIIIAVLRDRLSFVPDARALSRKAWARSWYSAALSSSLAIPHH
jgi:hypothetical protein